MGRKEGPAAPDACPEAQGLRLEEVEYGVSLWDARTVSRLPSVASRGTTESAPMLIRLITLAENGTGERSAGNPHATFEVAEAGNGSEPLWSPVAACGDRDERGSRYRASFRPYQ